MSGYSFSEENNVGGLLQIELAPAYAFASLTPAVVFHKGYGWDQPLILPESGQLSDESVETDNGLQYTYALTFQFNKKRADLIAALRPYLGTLAVAKVTDQNGLVQIIGNLQTPVTFKQNADSGKKPVDMNMLTFTGSCVADQEALIAV